MLRFWFKDKVDFIFLPETVQAKIKTCPISESKYFEIPCVTIMDPSVSWPHIPPEMVQRVTAVERIYRGLRTDGLYNHDGATLLVTTKFIKSQEVHAPGMWSEGWLLECQDICLSAPTVAALRVIYLKFRRGTLKATEDWEADPDENKPSEPAKSSDEEEKPFFPELD